MKNAQKPEKIHLGKLIDEIRKGKYVIPDFQREFDWHPNDIRELVKSIFMDYYIGTLLLWKGTKENFSKLSCKPIFAFKGSSDPEFIVLDGQQRLTAMHYAFFNPEENYRNRKNPIYFFMRLEKLLEENYDEAFFYYSKTKYYSEILENPKSQYEEKLFPLGVMKEGSWGIEDWIKGYRDYWREKSENAPDEASREEYDLVTESAKKVKELFADLLNNYQVSYIELDEDIEVGKVCDIFTHINSKGVKLDTFDLLNAITRPKDIYLKDMYRKASLNLDDTTFPGFEVKSYILMVMSLLKQNYCSPKYLYYLVPGEVKTIKKEGINEQVVLMPNSEAFVDSWENAVEVIKKALQSLKNPRDFGAISSKFLPYPSIIPALAAIKSFVADSNLKNKVDIHSKIRKWYWASIFLNRYSSAVESTSTKDFMDLKRWFNNDDSELECVSDFYREYRTLDLHRETKNGSAIYKAIFDLFILNEARDWETFELPEYENLDDHHIVPKSWGKENGLEKEINVILNRTPLSANTNRNIIGSNLPNNYLKRMFDHNDNEKVYKVLSSHLISKKAVSILLRDPFTVDDFRAFIEERRSSIINAIENIIISEKIDLPENLRVLDEQIELVELEMRKLILNRLKINNAEDVKVKMPTHIFPKIQSRVEREKRRNPALVEQKIDDPNFWMQMSDLRELEQIITSKPYWPSFESIFGNKTELPIEFNNFANLRNTIRHSREVDAITQMKGEASILWFKQQMKMD